MFAVYAVALLCLVSVSHSAPPACEDLVRPLDQLDPNRLEGRRALVAGSVKNAAIEEKFKRRDSATINYVNGTFMRVFGVNDSCQWLNSNMTLEENSFTFSEYSVNMTFLHTSCHDCVLMRFDKDSMGLVRLYLFSKRREVEQAEIDEFTALAQCLNMRPPVMMDPNKELCPEQISNHPDS